MESPVRAFRKSQWIPPQTPDSARFQRKSATKRAGSNAYSFISKLAGAKKGPLPDFIQPALALLSGSPPIGDNWLHEIKYDGYRLQARLDGGKARLLTRKGLDWTKRFPSIARTLEYLPLNMALLDGELIVEDEHGVSSFSGLQSDLKGKRHNRMAYMVFDLMYCNGFNLMGATQLDRKAAIQAVLNDLPPDSPVRYSEDLETGGKELLQHACRLGLEGIISKQANAKYISGRAGQWIKAKCNQRQEFVIVGYVPSTASRLAIGSLVLGYYQKGVLVHAGRVGTGFSNDLAVDLKRTLERLEAAQPKFKTAIAPANRRDVKWVQPKLVAEVEYRGWSSDNLLRQASFKGLREDKPAMELGLEK